MATVPGAPPGKGSGFDSELGNFLGWENISGGTRMQEHKAAVQENAGGKGQQMSQQSSGGYDASASQGSTSAPPRNTLQGNTGQGKSGNTSAGGQKEGPQERKVTSEFRDEDVYGPKAVKRWTDVKEYDDDNDRDLFEKENARLAVKYGGKFIHVKYLDSQPGRVGYYCQLCSAEMNARKSLELHCSGMKHLKRKDQWDKGDHDQERGEKSGGRPDKNSRRPNSRGPRDGYRPPPPQPWSERGPPRGDSYGGYRPRTEPPRPYRGPPSPPPNYRNDDRGNFGRRDDYGRYSGNYYDDYYRNEPGPYRPPFDRDPYDGRRSPPEVRHDYDHHSGPGPTRRDGSERFSRERFNPYGRREAPPPPVISGVPAFTAAGGVGEGSTSTPLFEGIADGSCSELLRKLSVCRVKNRDDTALATNVASFLILSLKEYYSKSGPPTIAHILDEIILKMNIMKDLQK